MVVGVAADGVTTNVSKKNMRMWRNWQTRRFQVPVGDHMGSSPFIRTILWRQKRYLPEKVRFHRAFFVFESL